MDKVLIFGGGPSIRYDVAHGWDGDIISCDAFARNAMRYTYKIPSHIITLEDSNSMNHMFANISEPKPKIVISTRTTVELREFLEKEKFEIIDWGDPLLEQIYNVGMMAWYFAWKELGYRKIYLTGFDSLINNKPSMLERFWQETFFEFKNHYAPKDLQTYIIGMRRFEPERTEFPGFDDLNKYKNYRMKIDEQFVKHQMGNNPEPFYQILL